MAQLNQVQRKRAFELIDEKVSQQKGLKKVGTKKLFMLAVVDRKIKFSSVQLIEKLSGCDSYYNPTTICIMELLGLNDLWDQHKKTIEDHNKEKSKEINELVQSLKDEITFGTELSIIQDALNRLDEFMK